MLVWLGHSQGSRDQKLLFIQGFPRFSRSDPYFWIINVGYHGQKHCMKLKFFTPWAWVASHCLRATDMSKFTSGLKEASRHHLAFELNECIYRNKIAKLLNYNIHDWKLVVSYNTTTQRPRCLIWWNIE